MPVLRTLFVTNIQGGTNTINNVDTSTTIAEFKKFVHDKTGIDPANQFLIAGTKPLRNECTLADYNIHNEQTFTLCLRLKGGMAEGEATVANDSETSALSGLVSNQNIGFGVTTKEDCVCNCSDENEWKFKLIKCSHIVCSYGLKNRIKMTAMALGLAILCPVTGCGTELDYNTISPYAGLLEEEQKTYEEKLGQAVIKASPELNTCPHCGCYLFKDHREIKITCVNCNGAPWCWLCLHRWASSDSGACGNESCGGALVYKINALENCGTTTISFGSISHETPKIRMCPNCQILLNHGADCKHMTCNKSVGGCGYEFCFVCLSKWSSPCNNGINCTVAPTQTPTNNFY